MVQAWFMGLTPPELDDAVPMTVLREGDPQRDGKRVLNAARAFIAGA